MRNFVENLCLKDPLEPQDAFYGGRTEAFTMYKETEGDTIDNYDVTSLYLFINKTGKIPLGHPKIITENFEDIDRYKGLIKCKIVPPRGLFLPVLPLKCKGKLLFGLCHTCMKNNFTDEYDTEIYFTSKVTQACLTETNETRVIEKLPSEIEVQSVCTDNPSNTCEKQTVKIIKKKVNSIILELTATPGIFENVETLKSALLTLVHNVQIAGEIDVEIEDTVNVYLTFESPLTKRQIAVVKCLFTEETYTDNGDKQLFDEFPPTEKTAPSLYQHESISAISKVEDCPNSQEDSNTQETIRSFDEKFDMPSSGYNFVDQQIELLQQRLQELHFAKWVEKRNML
ncbi:unnamed protein product [Mytilus coruscus]|uniref:DNA-directed DNA polymerase n=1 Tax=Mytilus coruscus TaxID=42192 RepID=A0A6J8ER77_MYTCO|nr:unnamed protein product [Mytilus coruscus]